MSLSSPGLHRCGGSGQSCRLPSSPDAALGGRRLTRPCSHSCFLGEQQAAVGQAGRRASRDRGRAIRCVLHAPAQARARLPHRRARPTAAVHRDVEGCPPPADGDRSQSPLEKWKRRGPSRAERRRRKPMAISGLAQGEGRSRVQVAPRMQQSANPCAPRIEASALQTSEEGSSASEALHWLGFRRCGSRTSKEPPQESGQGAPEPVRTAEVRQRERYASSVSHELKPRAA
jgi:hypothetical protein